MSGARGHAGGRVPQASAMRLSPLARPPAAQAAEGAGGQREAPRCQGRREAPGPGDQGAGAVGPSRGAHRFRQKKRDKMSYPRRAGGGVS